MRINHSRLFFALLFVFIFISTAAFAEESDGGKLRLGIGVAGMSSEYKKTDADILPIPVVTYEGERFFLRGFTGGMHIFKNSMHELSLNVSYLPQHYKARNSDDWAMRRLKNRHSTMLAGAGYSLKTEWGTGSIAFSGDVLDNSNGFLADASYSYPLAIGPVTLTPSGGVLWTSSQHNDYYYGVSGGESRKSGLKKYKADSGFSPYVGLGARYSFAEDWSVFLNGKAVFLSKEITDSPMVDDHVKYMFSTGVSYAF